MKWLDKLLNEMGYKAAPPPKASKVEALHALLKADGMTADQEYRVWRLRRQKARLKTPDLWINALSFN